MIRLPAEMPVPVAARYHVGQDFGLQPSTDTALLKALQLRRQRTRFCWHHKCATSWQCVFATHAQANTAELRTTPTSGVQVANRSEEVASREVAAEHLPLLSAATETDLVPVARAKAPLSVQHKRPNGTQSIRNYCQQHTNVFHHDFNARALRKRQERLQNGYPIQQTSLLQEVSPSATVYKQPVSPHTPVFRPGQLQQQLHQNQAAKRNTEQLYGAFLDAARDTAAAEANAKHNVERALSAEHLCVEETEARLEAATEQQELLEQELVQTHAMLDSAQHRARQLSRQLLNCKSSLHSHT